MELAAWLAGQPHNDHPQCVSPVITGILIRWNDRANDADRQLLKSYASRVLGTRSSDKVEDRRRWIAADWAIRIGTPIWLRGAGLDEHAANLEALAEITSWESWQAARDTVYVARDEARKARAKAAAADVAAVAVAVAVAADAVRKRLRPLQEQSWASAFAMLDRLISLGD